MPTRRRFLRSSALFAAGPLLAAKDDLRGEIGITTGSFMRHLSAEKAAGKLRLLDLPQIMREELDMRVIDLMTATLVSLEPAYLERLRAAAEKHGCLLTNLKMNQSGLDMASADPVIKQAAMRVYKHSIDAAALLGCRWVRPLPLPDRPDPQRLAAAMRELIDYAAKKEITVLVENYGWMMTDADAIPRVIASVGPALKAQPDTGNWKDNTTRYTGLEKAFPHAVSCDFKAFKLGPDGAHADYDLKKCFDIAWATGFRGPWCIEHFHPDLPELFQEMKLLRDLLRRWMRTD